MDKVVKAATPEEIARAEEQAKAKQAAAVAPQPAPARIVAREGREKVVPLEWPVEYDGVVYEALTVRRAHGADFRKMASFGGDEDMKLAALLTGAPAEVIAALDGEDYLNLQEVVKTFLPRKLQQMAEQISGTGQNTRP